MKSYLVIGDLHIDSNFKNLDFIIDIYKVEDFDYVIFLGDFFNNSYNVRKNDIKKAVEFIRKIDNKIIFLSGNHDIFGSEINNNNLFIYGFDKFKNVDFIVEQNNTVISDNFIFISYYTTGLLDDLVKVKKYISESNQDKYFIFSHNDISEFYIGTPAKKFVSIFKTFDDIKDKEIYFISGHIHEHRFLRKNNIRIISLGCFTQKDFRDKNEFPLFLHIKDNNINLYKYISNANIIHQKFYIKSYDDLGKIYNFISKYKFFNKKIKIFVTDPEIYYYLVNSYQPFQGDIPKILNINKINICMVDDDSYVDAIDNEVIENIKTLNFDDYDFDDEDSDVFYNIICDYVEDKYKNLKAEDIKNKIDLLYNTLNYIKDLDLN